MADETIEFRKIKERCTELKAWLQKKAPECLVERKHLKDGGAERAYWAHGYLSALSDVLQLFTRDIPDQHYDGEDTYPSRYAA